MISSLYSPELAERFPLLRQPAVVRRAAVLVLTANRGLAGAFNSNIIKEARNLIARLGSRTSRSSCTSSAAKGSATSATSAARSRRSRTDITDRPTVADAGGLVDGLMDRFAAGALDAVYVVSAKFKSALSTPPHTEQILPVTPPERKGPARDYLLFPSAEAILTELLAGVRAQRGLSRAGGERGRRSRARSARR